MGSIKIFFNGMARRYKSLQHGTQKEKATVWHREHRSKKNRRKYTPHGELKKEKLKKIIDREHHEQIRNHTTNN